MKKLLLLLMIVPMIGFGQTAEDYYNKAYDYAENGEYQLAIDNYTRAIRIDSNHAISYYNRGRLYGQKLNNLEEAIADYTRAIKIDPDNALTYTLRGYTYSELGNYEDAIADFTRVVRIDPDYAYAYLNRGAVYHSLGNYEDAIADYTRAVRVDPDYAKAYMNRGLAKEKSGLLYCSDYKRACDLGIEECCRWYKEDNCR